MYGGGLLLRFLTLSVSLRYALRFVPRCFGGSKPPPYVLCLIVALIKDCIFLGRAMLAPTGLYHIFASVKIALFSDEQCSTLRYNAQFASLFTTVLRNPHTDISQELPYRSNPRKVRTLLSRSPEALRV